VREMPVQLKRDLPGRYECLRGHDSGCLLPERWVKRPEIYVFDDSFQPWM
jgi:hypothetical protein